MEYEEKQELPFTADETHVQLLLKDMLEIFSKAKQGSSEDQTLCLQYWDNCFEELFLSKQNQKCN